jgi:hypothetical protein
VSSTVGSGVITLIVVTVALATFGIVTASAATPADATPVGMIGIRLIPEPGASSQGPLASSYIVAHLALGAELSRTVEIDNDSKATVNVDMYAAAASVVGGRFLFAEGATRNNLSSWTSVGSSQLRLRPYSNALVTVTTRVPPDATSGEDYAVLWAAESSAPAKGGGITLVSRVGVRMYVAVGTGGAHPSSFELGSLRAQRSTTGASVLVARVRNTGTNTLDLEGSLTLSNGPGGLRAGPFSAKLGVLLAPGESESVTVSLAPSFPRGPWRAVLNLNSGSRSQSRSQVIYFPARIAAPHKSKGGSVALDLSIIPGGLLVGAIPPFLHMRKRRRLARLAKI